MIDNQIIRISAYDLSRIFWPRVYEVHQHIYEEIGSSLRDLAKNNAALRTDAEYNTGSINLFDAFNLTCLVSFFKIDTIAEVGTFIGNSTTAMALGMSLRGLSGEIFTCDFSNKINLINPFQSVAISQFQKISSTHMFEHLIALGKRFPMMHFDGRIQDQDLPLIDKLITPETILVLDDFLGVEKGVANVLKLLSLENLRNHILVHPTDTSDIRALPFFHTRLELCATAVMLPRSKLIFSRT